MNFDSDNFWVRSDGERHVWYNTNTGYYTFEDETNNFNGEFNTYTEALAALQAYIVYLG